MSNEVQRNQGEIDMAKNKPTKDQIEYFKRRVSEIIHIKIQAISDNMYQEDRAILEAGLAKGTIKAKLLAVGNYHRCDVDFEFRDPPKDPRVIKLNQEKQSLIDQFVLGDMEDALKSLSELAE